MSATPFWKVSGAVYAMVPSPLPAMALPLPELASLLRPAGQQIAQSHSHPGRVSCSRCRLPSITSSLDVLAVEPLKPERRTFIYSDHLHRAFSCSRLLSYVGWKIGSV